MRRRLVTALLPLVLIGSQTNAGAEEKAPSMLPAMKVLPVGSSLHDLHIPQFDKNYQTTSTLFAKQLDILAEDKLKGSEVDITLFKDNKQQAATHLKSAFYSQTSGIIHSIEKLTISGDSFDIAAQGLILKWENRTGFLLGKTRTLFYSDIDKKMTSPVSKNQKKKSLSPVKSKAIATALATLPTLLSAEELQEIDALTVSSTAKIQQVDQQTNSEVQQMNLTAQSINKERSALQDQIISTSGTLTPAASSVDIKPKAEKIPVSVNCENGMYFDATTGTIVYQKDVVVTHPQYHLSCSKELKVLLKEKPGTEKPATAESKTDETLIPNASADKKFSGLSKAIATGNVLIKSKDKNGKLIIARSQTATYDADTGVIILRGGNPTVQQGDTIARILSDKGYIKILQNRSVRIEGRHEIKANLNELQDK